jgi:quercetin dioxygenase-like cupin family protein
MVNADRIPVVFAMGEGEALWCVGALTTVKAEGQQTGGAYALIEDHAPRGTGTPLHRHAEDDEAFYVLEGELTFYLDDAPPSRAGRGAFVHIPGGSVHAFRVESPTARYLIITTPHHAQFYRAMAEPARERAIPPDAELNMEMIGAACEAYGVEFVGPAPEPGPGQVFDEAVPHHHVLGS